MFAKQSGSSFARAWKSYVSSGVLAGGQPFDRVCTEFNQGFTHFPFSDMQRVVPQSQAHIAGVFFTAALSTGAVAAEKAFYAIQQIIGGEEAFAHAFIDGLIAADFSAKVLALLSGSPSLFDAFSAILGRLLRQTYLSFSTNAIDAVCALAAPPAIDSPVTKLQLDQYCYRCRFALMTLKAMIGVALFPSDALLKRVATAALELSPKSQNTLPLGASQVTFVDNDMAYCPEGQLPRFLASKAFAAIVGGTFAQLYTSVTETFPLPASSEYLPPQLVNKVLAASALCKSIRSEQAADLHVQHIALLRHTRDQSLVVCDAFAALFPYPSYSAILLGCVRIIGYFMVDTSDPLLPPAAGELVLLAVELYLKIVYLRGSTDKIPSGSETVIRAVLWAIELTGSAEVPPGGRHTLTASLKYIFAMFLRGTLRQHDRRTALENHRRIVQPSWSAGDTVHCFSSILQSHYVMANSITLCNALVYGILDSMQASASASAPATASELSASLFLKAYFGHLTVLCDAPSTAAAVTSSRFSHMLRKILRHLDGLRRLADPGVFDALVGLFARALQTRGAEANIYCLLVEYFDVYIASASVGLAATATTTTTAVAAATPAAPPPDIFSAHLLLLERLLVRTGYTEAFVESNVVSYLYSILNRDFVRYGACVLRIIHMLPRNSIYVDEIVSYLVYHYPDVQSLTNKDPYAPLYAGTRCLGRYLGDQGSSALFANTSVPISIAVSPQGDGLEADRAGLKAYLFDIVLSAVWKAKREQLTHTAPEGNPYASDPGPACLDYCVMAIVAQLFVGLGLHEADRAGERADFPVTPSISSLFERLIDTLRIEDPFLTPVALDLVVVLLTGHLPYSLAEPPTDGGGSGNDGGSGDDGSRRLGHGQCCYNAECKIGSLRLAPRDTHFLPPCLRLLVQDIASMLETARRSADLTALACPCGSQGGMLFPAFLTDAAIFSLFAAARGIDVHNLESVAANQGVIGPIVEAGLLRRVYLSDLEALDALFYVQCLFPCAHVTEHLNGLLLRASDADGPGPGPGAGAAASSAAFLESITRKYGHYLQAIGARAGYRPRSILDMTAASGYIVYPDTNYAYYKKFTDSGPVECWSAGVEGPTEKYLKSLTCVFWLQIEGRDEPGPGPVPVPGPRTEDGAPTELLRLSGIRVDAVLFSLHVDPRLGKLFFISEFLQFTVDIAPFARLGEWNHFALSVSGFGESRTTALSRFFQLHTPNNVGVSLVINGEPRYAFSAREFQPLPLPFRVDVAPHKQAKTMSGSAPRVPVTPPRCARIYFQDVALFPMALALSAVRTMYRLDKGTDCSTSALSARGFRLRYFDEISVTWHDLLHRSYRRYAKPCSTHFIDTCAHGPSTPLSARITSPRTVFESSSGESLVSAPRQAAATAGDVTPSATGSRQKVLVGSLQYFNTLTAESKGIDKDIFESIGEYLFFCEACGAVFSSDILHDAHSLLHRAVSVQSCQLLAKPDDVSSISVRELFEYLETAQGHCLCCLLKSDNEFAVRKHNALFYRLRGKLFSYRVQRCRGNEYDLRFLREFGLGHSSTERNPHDASATGALSESLRALQRAQAYLASTQENAAMTGDSSVYPTCISVYEHTGLAKWMTEMLKVSVHHTGLVRLANTHLLSRLHPASADRVVSFLNGSLSQADAAPDLNELALLQGNTPTKRQTGLLAAETLSYFTLCEPAVRDSYIASVINPSCIFMYSLFYKRALSLIESAASTLEPVSQNSYEEIAEQGGCLWHNNPGLILLSVVIALINKTHTESLVGESSRKFVRDATQYILDTADKLPVFFDCDANADLFAGSTFSGLSDMPLYTGLLTAVIDDVSGRLTLSRVQPILCEKYYDGSLVVDNFLFVPHILPLISKVGLCRRLLELTAARGLEATPSSSELTFLCKLMQRTDFSEDVGNVCSEPHVHADSRLLARRIAVLSFATIPIGSLWFSSCSAHTYIDNITLSITSDIFTGQRLLITSRRSDTATATVQDLNELFPRTSLLCANVSRRVIRLCSDNHAYFLDPYAIAVYAGSLVSAGLCDRTLKLYEFLVEQMCYRDRRQQRLALELIFLGIERHFNGLVPSTLLEKLVTQIGDCLPSLLTDHCFSLSAQGGSGPTPLFPLLCDRFLEALHLQRKGRDDAPPSDDNLVRLFEIHTLELLRSDIAKRAYVRPGILTPEFLGLMACYADNAQCAERAALLIKDPSTVAFVKSHGSEAALSITFYDILHNTLTLALTGDAGSCSLLSFLNDFLRRIPRISLGAILYQAPDNIFSSLAHILTINAVLEALNDIMDMQFHAGESTKLLRLLGYPETFSLTSLLQILRVLVLECLDMQTASSSRALFAPELMPDLALLYGAFLSMVLLVFRAACYVLLIADAKTLLIQDYRSLLEIAHKLVRAVLPSHALFSTDLRLLRIYFYFLDICGCILSHCVSDVLAPPGHTISLALLYLRRAPGFAEDPSIKAPMFLPLFLDTLQVSGELVSTKGVLFDDALGLQVSGCISVLLQLTDLSQTITYSLVELEATRPLSEIASSSFLPLFDIQEADDALQKGRSVGLSSPEATEPGMVSASGEIGPLEDELSDEPNSPIFIQAPTQGRGITDTEALMGSASISSNRLGEYRLAALVSLHTGRSYAASFVGTGLAAPMRTPNMLSSRSIGPETTGSTDHSTDTRRSEACGPNELGKGVSGQTLCTYEISMKIMKTSSSARFIDSTLKRLGSDLRARAGSSRADTSLVFSVINSIVPLSFCGVLSTACSLLATYAPPQAARHEESSLPNFEVTVVSLAGIHYGVFSSQFYTILLSALMRFIYRCLATVPDSRAPDARGASLSESDALRVFDTVLYLLRMRNAYVYVMALRLLVLSILGYSSDSPVSASLPIDALADSPCSSSFSATDLLITSLHSSFHDIGLSPTVCVFLLRIVSALVAALYDIVLGDRHTDSQRTLVDDNGEYAPFVYATELLRVGRMLLARLVNTETLRPQISRVFVRLVCFACEYLPRSVETLRVLQLAYSCGSLVSAIGPFIQPAQLAAPQMGPSRSVNMGALSSRGLVNDHVCGINATYRGTRDIVKMLISNTRPSSTLQQARSWPPYVASLDVLYPGCGLIAAEAFVQEVMKGGISNWQDLSALDTDPLPEDIPLHNYAQLKLFTCILDCLLYVFLSTLPSDTCDMASYVEIPPDFFSIGACSNETDKWSRDLHLAAFCLIADMSLHYRQYCLYYLARTVCDDDPDMMRERIAEAYTCMVQLHGESDTHKSCKDMAAELLIAIIKHLSLRKILCFIRADQKVGGVYADIMLAHLRRRLSEKTSLSLQASACGVIEPRFCAYTKHKHTTSEQAIRTTLECGMQVQASCPSLSATSARQCINLWLNLCESFASHYHPRCHLFRCTGYHRSHFELPYRLQLSMVPTPLFNTTLQDSSVTPDSDTIWLLDKVVDKMLYANTSLSDEFLRNVSVHNALDLQLPHTCINIPLSLLIDEQYFLGIYHVQLLTLSLESVEGTLVVTSTTVHFLPYLHFDYVQSRDLCIRNETFSISDGCIRDIHAAILAGMTESPAAVPRPAGLPRSISGPGLVSAIAQTGRDVTSYIQSLFRLPPMSRKAGGQSESDQPFSAFATASVTLLPLEYIPSDHAECMRLEAALLAKSTVCNCSFLPSVSYVQRAVRDAVQNAVRIPLEDLTGVVRRTHTNRPSALELLTAESRAFLFTFADESSSYSCHLRLLRRELNTRAMLYAFVRESGREPGSVPALQEAAVASTNVLYSAVRSNVLSVSGSTKGAISPSYVYCCYAMREHALLTLGYALTTRGCLAASLCPGYDDVVPYARTETAECAAYPEAVQQYTAAPQSSILSGTAIGEVCFGMLNIIYLELMKTYDKARILDNILSLLLAEADAGRPYLLSAHATSFARFCGYLSAPIAITKAGASTSRTAYLGTGLSPAVAARVNKAVPATRPPKERSDALPALGLDDLFLPMETGCLDMRMQAEDILLRLKTPLDARDKFCPFAGDPELSEQIFLFSRNESYRTASILNAVASALSLAFADLPQYPPKTITPDVSLQDIYTRTAVVLSTLYSFGRLTNSKYLLALNALAGRSMSSLAQYTVFPWIFQRELYNPLGNQAPGKAEKYIDRYGPNIYKENEAFNSRLYVENHDPPSVTGPSATRVLEKVYLPLNAATPFHYGTHYSASGAVVNFLVRIQPFEEMLRRLQGGAYDNPDRLFHSLLSAWENIKLRNISECKELIPELFFMPNVLRNDSLYILGTRTDGVEVGDVILPNYSGQHKSDSYYNSLLFVAAQKAALDESIPAMMQNLGPCYSLQDVLARMQTTPDPRSLAGWVNLIFGPWADGSLAERAINVYYWLSYHASVSLDFVPDRMLRRSLYSQMCGFGSSPRLLFPLPNNGQCLWSFAAFRTRISDQLTALRNPSRSAEELLYNIIPFREGLRFSQVSTNAGGYVAANCIEVDMHVPCSYLRTQGHGFSQRYQNVPVSQFRRQVEVLVSVASSWNVLKDIPVSYESTSLPSDYSGRIPSFGQTQSFQDAPLHHLFESLFVTFVGSFLYFFDTRLCVSQAVEVPGKIYRIYTRNAHMLVCLFSGTVLLYELRISKEESEGLFSAYLPVSFDRVAEIHVPAFGADTFDYTAVTAAALSEYNNTLVLGDSCGVVSVYNLHTLDCMTYFSTPEREIFEVDYSGGCYGTQASRAILHVEQQSDVFYAASAECLFAWTLSGNLVFYFSALPLGCDFSITTFFACGDLLLVGTANGYVLVLDSKANVALPVVVSLLVNAKQGDGGGFNADARTNVQFFLPRPSRIPCTYPFHNSARQSFSTYVPTGLLRLVLNFGESIQHICGNRQQTTIYVNGYLAMSLPSYVIQLSEWAITPTADARACCVCGSGLVSPYVFCHMCQSYCCAKCLSDRLYYNAVRGLRKGSRVCQQCGAHSDMQGSSK